MAAVKASTCINVFMRRRTSTHTHTLSLVKAFCMSAPQRKTRSRGKKRGGKMRRKQSQFTIQLGVEVLRARDQPATFVCVVLCCAVLLMSLPHSCRCIASMPQRGIFHIGMCTMEITMQSQAGRQQLTNNHPKISNQVHFRTHTNQNVVGRATSHEPKPKSNPETKQAAKENASPLPPHQHHIKQSSSVARCRFLFRFRFLYIRYAEAVAAAE